MRPKAPHSLLKLGARIKARGVREVVGVAAQRARDWVSSSEELIVLSRDVGGPAPIADGLRFKEATAADAVRYARDIGTDSVFTFRARLANDTRCFVVQADSSFVHATWMTTGAAWTREVGGYLRPPCGHAYVYESFTRAEARGRGVYPFALKAIAAWLAWNGAEVVWVAVEASNRASARAVSKAGFEPRFRITYRRSLGRLEVRASGSNEGAELLELQRPHRGRAGRFLSEKLLKRADRGSAAEQGEP